MKPFCLAPWLVLRWEKNVLLASRVHLESVLLTYPQIECDESTYNWIKARESSLDWLELLPQDPQTSARRTVLQKLMGMGAFLTQQWSEIYSYPKDYLPGIAEHWKDWKGWSKLLQISPDENRKGWWLEVPGAKSSLWAKELETLCTLLSQALSDSQKKWLHSEGFDGSLLGERVERMTQPFEWLWLESSRFLGRLGPLAQMRESSGLCGLMKVAEVDLEQSSSRTRRSQRSITGRRELSIDDYTSVIEEVFGAQEFFMSPKYGLRPRAPGPSGGAAWECEAWVVQFSPQAALFRFDASTRKMQRIECAESLFEHWKKECSRAWASPETPHALIVIAADFTILMEKYFRLSHQLTHLNAGLRCQELLSLMDQKGWGSCVIGGGVTKELASLVGWHPLCYGPVVEIAICGTD